MCVGVNSPIEQLRNKAGGGGDMARHRGFVPCVGRSSWCTHRSTKISVASVWPKAAGKFHHFLLQRMFAIVDDCRQERGLPHIQIEHPENMNSISVSLCAALPK